jgi:hypothetical protein
MTDDLDFISNVKTLSQDGTLAELLRRIEEIHTGDWKHSTDPAQREKCWHMVEAILQLKATIHGLTTDEKVKEFNTRLRRSS